MDFEKIKCVIFDFDGVILDSSGLKTECFKELYYQYEDIYEEAMLYHYEHKGMSRFRQFDYITKNLMDVADPAVEAKEMADKFANIVFDAVSKAPFIPGARELVEFLSLSVPLYIISSAPHNELEKIIIFRELEKYFVEYFGSVDNKDQYIKDIMKKTALEPNNILYVGDTLKDLDAAKKAEVHFCGVANKLADFSGQKCLLVSDLHELKRKLSGMDTGK